jgi:hypothetical protein
LAKNLRKTSNLCFTSRIRTWKRQWEWTCA